MEDNLKKIRNGRRPPKKRGRRPPKKKKGRRPQTKIKNEDDTKKLLFLIPL